MATRNIVPRADEEGNLGATSKRWIKGWFKDVFIGGSFSDGTITKTLSELATATPGRVTVNDANFTILNTHHMVCVTALTASRTLTLPVPDGVVRKFIIKDEAQKACLYPIRLTPTSGVTICGLPYIDINVCCGIVSVYSDGSNYFVYSASPNSGQVKINTGNAVKPSLSFTSGNLGVFQSITYSSPLGISSFPTTKWPKNIDTPSDSDIYDFSNNTFIENTSPGQVQRWRIIFSYTGKATNKMAGLVFKLANTLSGFILKDLVAIPVTSASGDFFCALITIADGASLPAPFGTGQGYIFEITSDSVISLTVESITRVSIKQD